jgi:hypothetical protein
MTKFAEEDARAHNVTQRCQLSCYFVPTATRRSFGMITPSLRSNRRMTVSISFHTAARLDQGAQISLRPGLCPWEQAEYIYAGCSPSRNSACETGAGHTFGCKVSVTWPPA